MTTVLMKTSNTESPSCVQLFGSDPEDFKRATDFVDCDIIDINMGCPMPKIVKNGDGSALLLDPERAGKIVQALCQNSDKPINVKTRLGYYVDRVVADELMQAVEENGASAITLHGRYAEQRYSGESDIGLVAKLAKKIRVPVIYNGDITSREQANDILNGYDGVFSSVAIGRGSLSNPMIFSGGSIAPVDYAKKLIAKLTKYFDDRYSINQLRKFFVHIFKGVIGSKPLKNAVNNATTLGAVETALNAFACNT